MRTDGTRRFRRVWEEVPRKNGKSTKLSGVGLYLFRADGEGGPEVYTAATKLDQAKITHDEAVRMVQSSPHLRRSISDRRGELFVRGKADVFKPLGRDSKSLDGLNPHGAIFDEVHAMPDSALHRRDPLRYRRPAELADVDDHHRWHQPARPWLRAVLRREGAGGCVRGRRVPGHHLHRGRSGARQDPTEWAKANPNLGVSVYRHGLKEACDSAIRLPSEQPEFKTKRLNIWLSGGAKWISLADWRR